LKAFQLSGLRSMAMRAVSDLKIERPTDVLIRMQAGGDLRAL
jgi:hypothetical protein